MVHIVAFKTAQDSDYAVRYLQYDPELPMAFAELRRLIVASVPGVRMEHVGSSAIPGVGGRNVLDVAVVAPTMEHTALRTNLIGLGFQDSPFEHYLPLLVAEAVRGDTAYPVLLYIVTADSAVLGDWLRFREHMRAHPADAAAYDQVKRSATGGHPLGGEAYQEAKTPFITDVMNMITTTGHASDPAASRSVS